MLDWNPRVLSPNEVLELLVEPRRRRFMYALHDAGGVLTVKGAALSVAADERDVRPEDVRVEWQDRVAVSLLHHHLPALTDAETVTYDRATGEVALDDGAEDLTPFLRLTVQADDVRFDADDLVT